MFNTILYGISNGITSLSSDITFIVLFALLTLITVFAAAYVINVSVKKQDKKKNKSNRLFGAMLIIVFVGIAVRVVLSLLVVGYRPEFSAIAGEEGVVWKIINEGFSGYYGETEANAIYPLTLYILSLFATLGSWFGMTPSSRITPFFMKLPFLLADLGCIIMLYRITKKYFNQTVAVVVAGLYAICPIFLFASSVWGSIYTIVAFFMLLTFYFLAQKKFLPMFISYSLCLLTSKEAAYLFPMLAVYVIYQMIMSFKLNRKEQRSKPLSFAELFKSKERGLFVRVPIYFVACLLGMYIISLPFIFTDYNANFFVWLNEFYLKGLGKVEYYSYNSLGLYNIFGMNGDMFGTRLVALFIVLFMAIIVALTLIYYLSKKNRANLIMLGAFIYMTLSIFFIDFKEMTVFPVFILLLLSFVFIKDRRLLLVFVMYAVVFVINASVVMAYGGYLNNLAQSAFASTEYTGGNLLTSTAGKVINIVLSALALIIYLYMTYVLMDISMNGNRKLFNGQEKLNPLCTLKHWIAK